MKLRAKIVGSIVAALILTSGISFYITERRVNKQAEDGFLDKVRQITGMANATKSWHSEHIDSLVPDGKFTNLNQIPVVAAWRVAEQYTKAENMVFRTPSLQPRNPKNQADAFERRALESFDKDPARVEYYERLVENGNDVMRYAQPVRLTQDCLVCHGTPAGEIGPFGYAKEGMKAGDLRGAFAVTASTEKLVQNASSNFWVLFLCTLLTLLAAAGVVWFLVEKLILHPLSASVDMLRDIAEGEGDLTKRLEVHSQDEIGEVSHWFNVFINKLQGIIREVETNTQQLAGASEQLSSSASEIARATSGQKDEARQVATAMHEMSVTVSQVCENSDHASKNARTAAKLAETGGEIVQNTVDLIRDVADSTRSTVLQVEKLGASSERIGTIISVIDDIADQTNLLALNAAIEAARAGEQGRGFAVVADEVRKLAERTSQATKEIADMIRTIQGETSSAVESIRSGTSRVEGGVEAASKAGKALQEIVDSSLTMQDVVGHIATAAVEQVTASSDINNSMEQIAKMAEQSSIAAQESSKACEDLSNLAQSLQQIVNKFKTGDRRSTTGRNLNSAASRPARQQPEPSSFRHIQ
jgi:methyl-accepting chemotaxis protein